MPYLRKCNPISHTCIEKISLRFVSFPYIMCISTVSSFIYLRKFYWHKIYFYKAVSEKGDKNEEVQVNT